MTASLHRPWLTVIVISKDDPSGLTATLRSIESQSNLPDEVVLVTKGSSSDLDLAAFHLPSLRHEAQQDQGISSAFNLALSLASGEWVNFLNGGDTFSNAGVVDALRSRFRADIDIVAGRARDRKTGNLIPRDLYFNARRVDQISHQASLFRRALFERHGGYSPDFKIRMDFEWMLRVADEARVEWVDDVLCEFEGGGASSIDPVRSCREELDALRLHDASWTRRARLFGLYLPFRVVRGWMRNLRSGQP